MKQLSWFFLIALASSGCQAPLPTSSVWNGSLQVAPERAIPFRLYLNLTGIRPSGYFLVSDERTEIPAIEVNGDSIRLTFTGYDAEMMGVWDGSRWEGSYLRLRKDTSVIPFTATPGEGVIASARSSKAAPSGVRLTGNFRVLFETSKGIDSSSTATFWTKGDSVYGTFIDPSGDYGLMVGAQSGSTASLHRFTGWQANLLELQQSEDRWQGKFYSRNLPAQLFALVPRTSALIITPEVDAPRIKNPRKPFAFRGISIDGDTILSTDPMFTGKVLVVDVMGTWCHNCMDAAPLLNQIASDFRDRGVVVVGLSFEITENPGRGRSNLASYRDRYGIRFPLLFCGSTQGKDSDEILRSQIVNFGAYPTTLFIDRKGIVRDIHAGFLGPGTGDAYLSQVQQYFSLVRKLVQ